MMPLAIGREQGGLYHLQLPHSTSPFPHPVSNSNVLLTDSKDKLSVIWHMRLGHASHSVLSHIDDVRHDVSASRNKSCPVCPLAKQCKLPFPNASTSFTSSLFELLHVDVWGPYSIQTQHGCKYFLTIVDDYSRATWTFLIPTKQHVHKLLTDFLAYAYTQFGKYVKFMRSDNGTEFFN